MAILTLKVRGPKGIVSISIDEDASLKELKGTIAENLDLEDEDGFDILAGFPPSPLKIEDESPIKGHVSNNESIRIQPKELSGVQAQGKPNKKRAANSATKEASSNRSQPLTFGAKIATLHPAPIRKVTRPSSQPQPKRRRLSKSDIATSEADICEHLIQAVGGQKGTRGKILRKVFRDAVSHQYNATKAIARLNAVYGGLYRMQGVDHGLTLNSSSNNSLPIASKLHVTFHRGAGSRGTHEETVDLIPTELLVALIKLPVEQSQAGNENEDGFADREILKPINLAKASPRIFWSLVFHYGPNMIHNIQQILREHVHPDMNLDWLLDRKRELSEKAKENLAQKQQQEERRKQQQSKRKKETGTNENITEDTNNSHANLEDTINIQPLTTTTAAKEVVEIESQVPPLTSELVKNELIDGEWDQFQIDEIVPPEFVTFMATLLSSSCALSLAAYEIDSISCTKIDAFNQVSAKQSSALRVSEEQIDWWVERAQEYCAHYFWRRICGQGSELLRKLLLSLRIRVPKELLMWEKAHEALYQGLLKLNHNLHATPFYWPTYLTTSSVAPMDAEKVRWMINLSRDWLVAYPWMSKVSAQDLFGRWEDNDSDDAVNEWDNEWIIGDVHSTEYMMKRCRVTVRFGEEDDDVEEVDDDEESGEEKIQKESHKQKIPFTKKCKNYWEYGTVVGYLPSTEEDPMALWKVKLDAIKTPKQSASSSSGANTINTTIGTFEDLEFHELQEAIQAYGEN
jgi:hypothetical protein